MATFEVPIQAEFSADYLGQAFPAEVDEVLDAYLPPGERVQSWSYRYAKRAIDLILGSVMLLLVFVPCLLIAGAVVATSDGPVFYREDRIGRGGRVFQIFKFRSMHRERVNEVRSAPGYGNGFAGDETLLWRVHKSGYNSRITGVGHVLRRWSLDELPQLINVLRGEMSLIGPRPVVAAEIPLYGRMQQCYMAALPGLSGLWQVSGRSDTGFPMRAKLDADYVRNWSLHADVKILISTIPAVLGRVGAR